MSTVVIKPRQVPALTLNIADKEYKLPLASGLTIKEANALNTFDGTIAFYKRHIPAKVIDSLTIDEINQVTEAWRDACAAAGADAGK